jgi:hypothetical protein
MDRCERLPNGFRTSRTVLTRVALLTKLLERTESKEKNTKRFMQNGKRTHRALLELLSHAYEPLICTASVFIAANNFDQ